MRAASQLLRHAHASGSRIPERHAAAPLIDNAYGSRGSLTQGGLVKIRTSKVKLAMSIVGALSLGVLAISTSPAVADGTYSGLAYVHGGGDYTDDWGDEGVVDVNANNASNATCLWQKVLWADGDFSASDIDGHFGSLTKSATKTWQSHYGVSADGSAGKNTWTEAGTHLNYVSGYGDPGSTLTLQYVGWSHVFTLVRNTAGTYTFPDGSGTTRDAGYNYLSCS